MPQFRFIVYCIAIVILLMLQNCTPAIQGDVKPISGILHKTYSDIIYSYADSTFLDSGHSIFIDINDDAINDLKINSPRNSNIGGIGNQAKICSIEGINGTSISCDTFGWTYYSVPAFLAKGYNIHSEISSDALYKTQEILLDFAIFADMYNQPMYSLKTIGVQLTVDGEIHNAWVSFLFTIAPQYELGVWQFTEHMQVLKSGYSNSPDAAIKVGS